MFSKQTVLQLTLFHHVLYNVMSIVQQIAELCKLHDIHKAYFTFPLLTHIFLFVGYLELI